MIFRLHPEAANDLRDAARYYFEHANAALSQALFAEFDRAVKVLIAHPQWGSPWRAGFRRYLMRRFPYSIFYSIADEEIRIMAVAHQSRRPGYWQSRKWAGSA